MTKTNPNWPGWTQTSPTHPKTNPHLYHTQIAKIHTEQCGFRLFLIKPNAWYMSPISELQIFIYDDCFRWFKNRIVHSQKSKLLYKYVSCKFHFIFCFLYFWANFWCQSSIRLLLIYRRLNLVRLCRDRLKAIVDLCKAATNAIIY